MKGILLQTDSNGLSLYRSALVYDYTVVPLMVLQVIVMGCRSK